MPGITDRTPYPVPEERKVPWRRSIADLPKALRNGPRGVADLARAVAELALANRRLAHEPISRMSLVAGIEDASTPLGPNHSAMVERVAFAVPVMAMRVPWRADCLVQALAARRWLSAEGIVAHISIGTTRDDQGVFRAHAWVRVDERIVTGGDIARYGEFSRRASS